MPQLQEFYVTSSQGVSPIGPGYKPILQANEVVQLNATVVGSGPVTVNFADITSSKLKLLSWDNSSPFQQEWKVPSTTGDMTLQAEGRSEGSQFGKMSGSISVVQGSVIPIPPTPVPIPPNNNPSIPTKYLFQKSVAGLTNFKAFDIITCSGVANSAADFWKLSNTLHGREWQSCIGYPGLLSLNSGLLSKMLSYKNQGFKFTLVLAGEGEWTAVNNALPTPQGSSECAKKLLDFYGDVVDSWEVGNEPNGSYWPGNDPQKFVDCYANPMYEIFHAAGKEVISAGVTYDTKYVKKLFDAGIKCDVVGFHPYRQSASALDSQLSQLAAISPPEMPWDFTEYNVFLGGNYRASFDPKNAKSVFPSMNADQVVAVQNSCLPILNKYKQIRRVSYFTSNMSGMRTSTSPLELIDDSKRTTPFYDRHWSSF